MEGSNGWRARINSFALVSYLEGPLANLLDEIRHDFVPESRAKAHVTILPPRPLAANPPGIIEPAVVVEYLKGRLQDMAPFRIELGDIEVFPDTFVIYVSIKQGFRELERMHQALNTGYLAFNEPHPYHPHVTVVQGLAPEEVPAAAQFARRQWSEFKHSRNVLIDRLTFVQNTVENCWTDLAMLELGSPVAR